ncbi:MAG TPA: ElyC/SanA/YdcF family protein [Clostridiales bacterium]|nr:ElyC/SanA/YdcF family protein [Clostridiales bacterium]
MIKRKAKKKLSNALLVLMLVSILVLASILIIDAYVKSSVKDKIITSDEASSLDSDCILVLGAGVWNNGRPSPMLEDRLLQGIELYENGASDRLLMSGDHGRKEYDEVNAMKRFAIDKNIPSEHIFMDHAGFSTYESMYRARDIFQAHKIIIVTQKYHLYRAMYIAEKLGLDAYGVASDPRQYVGQEYRELREVLARVKDFFKVIIKPEPTYLGQTIPVSGNGDLTND